MSFSPLPLRPPLRLPLSGVVTAPDLTKQLHPILEAVLFSPPRRLVIACTHDVIVRPRAIGVLYRTLLTLCQANLEMLAVEQAPRELRMTLDTLFTHVRSTCTTHFVDNPQATAALLVRDALRRRLSTPVPFSTEPPDALSTAESRALRCEPAPYGPESTSPNQSPGGAPQNLF